MAIITTKCATIFSPYIANINPARVFRIKVVIQEVVSLFLHFHVALSTADSSRDSLAGLHQFRQHLTQRRCYFESVAVASCMLRALDLRHEDKKQLTLHHKQNGNK